MESNEPKKHHPSLAHVLQFFVALVVALLCLSAGCDYDDPDDGVGEEVDFITFSTPGTFSEIFFDIAFQSGEMAIDVIAAQPLRTWRLGPRVQGWDLLPAIDDDAAPYPNPSRARKQTPDGLWDKRYWVQFAGGPWSSLHIQVDDTEAKYRASASPPSFFPTTAFMWCPSGLSCRTWDTAVRRREVRCYRYGLNGNPKPVGATSCLWHHPRMHWRVVECDDCPIPTAEPIARTDD